MLRKLLIGIAVVVVVLVAAAVVVPMVVPVDTYKDEITSQVKQATGRDLAINGDISLSILPSLALEVTEVTFSNAPGAKEPQMARLQELQVGVKLLPLLSGELEVDQFVLVEPVIHLEVDAEGRPNWQFETAASAEGRPAPDQSSETAQPSGDGSDGMGLSDVRLGDIRLVNGLVTYGDRRSGEEMQVSNVSLTITLPDIASPLDIDGRVTWKGEEIALSGHADALADLLSGAGTGTRLTVESAPVTLTFEGTAAAGGANTAEGTVVLDVPSVRGLAAWAAEPIEMEGDALGPLKIEGNLAVEKSVVSFSNASLALDDIRANGNVAFDAGGALPYVKGDLDVERLDLNPYLGGTDGPAGETASGDAGGAGTQPAAGGAGGEWSDEPIDAGALQSANADFSLRVGALIYQQITVGQSAVNAALKNGVLMIDLTELALYDGSGSGQVVLDGRTSALKIEERFTLQGLQAEPFLADAAGFDRLSGVANATIAVTGQGRSQREIVSSLNGNGDVTFLDGAIRGINLAAMVRSISLDSLRNGIDESQKTDFTEMTGTFVIQKGILRNDDLRLLAPLVRVEGAGTSDLPKRLVDYRIKPKAVPTLEGQGGAQDKKGVVLPILVKGPWHDVSWGLDFSNPLQFGAGLADGIEGIGIDKDTGLGGMIEKALPGADGADPGAVIKDLLKGQGAAASGQDAGAGEQKTPQVGDVLKQIIPEQAPAESTDQDSGGDAATESEPKEDPLKSLQNLIPGIKD